MNTSTPLVSIIIPTYNRANLIGETLDSVLAQTYTNWECIIVDDGSTDNTDEVVDKYVQKDARFKYYHRPDTHLPGGNGARNYGFLQSKGEYIQWFDSDDVMLNSKIEIKITEAIKNNADIIVDAHTEKLQNIDTNEIAKALKVFQSTTFYKDFALGKHHLITDDVLVKRSVIGQLKFDEHLFKAQEYDFFIRLFNQNLVYVFIDLPLTIYRVNDGSISQSSIIKKSESLIYLSKKMMRQFEDDKDIVERAKRQGRKTYKSLAKNKNLKMIFKHFHFFQKAHNKTTVVFFLMMIYNLATGKGFDRVKPKNI